MPWLVRDAKVLATLEVAASLRDRTRGLLGRDGIDGAIALQPARSVHTFRMRFPIDVAFCDRELRVLKVVTLAPNRVTLPVLKARTVIECEAGMMAKWGVRPGDRFELRGVGRASEERVSRQPPESRGLDDGGDPSDAGERPATEDPAGR